MLIGQSIKFRLAETGKVVDSAMRESHVKPPRRAAVQSKSGHDNPSHDPWKIHAISGETIREGCRRRLQQLCTNSDDPGTAMQLEEHQSCKIHFDLEAHDENLNVIDDWCIAEHEAFELGATIDGKPDSVHVQCLQCITGARCLVLRCAIGICDRSEQG